MAEPRVTHLVPALFGPRGVVGGAERYAHELAKAMAERIPTRLVTFGPQSDVLQDGALEIRLLGGVRQTRGQQNNPFSLQLLGALRDAKVVHCHQQHVLASSLAAAYCRMTRRKVFVSDLGGGGWDISAYVSTDGWYHGHLHISQYSRKISGHIENPRAHVILGGVDTEKFSPGDAYRADSVLYVGRILPHKGINYLIDALPSDLALRVIGRPYDAKYMQHLEVSASGKDITFVHDADDTLLVEAYRSASCIVLPSVYETMYGLRTDVPELLGQTLLEGMACGIPALCTDVAGMPEVVEHGVAGFVVPPNDPGALRDRLLWFQANGGEAAQMGKRARQRVLERFSWGRVVESCLKIYRGQTWP